MLWKRDVRRIRHIRRTGNPVRGNNVKKEIAQISVERAFVNRHKRSGFCKGKREFTVERKSIRHNQRVIAFLWKHVNNLPIGKSVLFCAGKQFLKARQICVFRNENIRPARKCDCNTAAQMSRSFSLLHARNAQNGAHYSRILKCAQNLLCGVRLFDRLFLGKMLAGDCADN